MRHIIFLLLPFLSTAIELLNNPFYLQCDDVKAQNDYIRQERIAFAIDNDMSAFSANLIYSSISHRTVAIRWIIITNRYPFQNSF